MGRIFLINPKSRFLREGSHGNRTAKMKYLKIWKRCWCVRQMQELRGKQRLPAPSMRPGHGQCWCPAALPLPPRLVRLPQAGSSHPAHHPAHRHRGPQPLWGISPLSTRFSTRETAGHKAIPFGNCSHCYHSSLAKEGGKCNLSEDQTFPRPLPSEMAFVGNFRLIPDNLGWGEQTKECC